MNEFVEGARRQISLTAVSNPKHVRLLGLELLPFHMQDWPREAAQTLDLRADGGRDNDPHLGLPGLGPHP